MIRTLYYKIKGLLMNVGADWDKLAPTEETAINFAHENINEEPIRKIDEDHYSMEYVLAHYGEMINWRFREDRADETDMEVAEMVNNHKTSTDIVVYRGVCEEVFKQMIENAKGIPGCDLYEKAFLATSLVKGHECKDKTRLRIYVPAGTKAVYQGNVNDELKAYYEVDIMLGAALKIISIDDTYINCKLLYTN